MEGAYQSSTVIGARNAKVWCERGDSNPHGLPRQILSLVRLPIPPLSHDHHSLDAKLGWLQRRRVEYWTKASFPWFRFLSSDSPPCHQLRRRFLRHFLAIVQYVQVARQLQKFARFEQMRRALRAIRKFHLCPRVCLVDEQSARP